MLAREARCQPVGSRRDVLHDPRLVKVTLLAKACYRRTHRVRESLELDGGPARPCVDLDADTVDGGGSGGADHHLPRLLELPHR